MVGLIWPQGREAKYDRWSVGTRCESLAPDLHKAPGEHGLLWRLINDLEDEFIYGKPQPGCSRFFIV